jgi:magnesium chelatase family protein
MLAFTLVIPVSTLSEAVSCFPGNKTWSVLPQASANSSKPFFSNDIDFANVRRQDIEIRALFIAAAAQHNISMVGPQGSGETMLAKRLPTILP